MAHWVARNARSACIRQGSFRTLQIFLPALGLGHGFGIKVEIKKIDYHSSHKIQQRLHPLSGMQKGWLFTWKDRRILFQRSLKTACATSGTQPGSAPVKKSMLPKLPFKSAFEEPAILIGLQWLFVLESDEFLTETRLDKQDKHWLIHRCRQVL